MGNPPLVQCLRAFSFMRHCAMFSVWPWLQGTDFRKQMWRLLSISWWKKENSVLFTYLYMLRNMRRKKKKLLKGKLCLPLSYLPSPYLLFPTLLFLRTFTLPPFWQRASLHLLHQRKWNSSFLHFLPPVSPAFAPVLGPFVFPPVPSTPVLVICLSLSLVDEHRDQVIGKLFPIS